MYDNNTDQIFENILTDCEFLSSVIVLWLY